MNSADHAKTGDANTKKWSNHVYFWLAKRHLVRSSQRYVLSVLQYKNKQVISFEAIQSNSPCSVLVSEAQIDVSVCVRCIVGCPLG